MKSWEFFLSHKKPSKVERLLRGLLLFTLLFQAVLVVLWKVRLPIPSLIMKNLYEYASTQGLALETTKASFSLSGKIRLEKVGVSVATGNLAPLAFLETVEYRLQLGSVLLGNFTPVHAIVDGHWLLASSQESINPVVEKFSGRLHAKNGLLRFVLNAEGGNAVLDIRGTWDAEKVLSDRKMDVRDTKSLFTKKGFPELHSKILRLSKRLKGSLRHCEKPVLGLYLSLVSRNEANLFAESKKVEFYSYSTGPVQCKAEFEFTKEEKLTAALSLDSRKLKWQGKESNATLRKVNACLKGLEYGPGSKSVLPHIEARLEGLSLLGKFEAELPTIHLEALPLGDKNFIIFAGMGTGASRVNLKGKANPSTNTIEGSLSLAIKPSDFSSHTLASWRENNFLNTSRPFRAKIGPMRLEDGNFTGSTFSVAADEMIIRWSPPATYRIRGNVFQNGHILAHDVYGKLGQSEVTGSIRQNWPDLDYRFLLEGTCLPIELNPWLRNWWARIWLDCTFGEEVPHGDFDIQGRWRSRGTHTTTYGSVGLENLVYRGLPVEKGFLKVIVSREKTRLAEVRLKPTQGEVRGEFSISRSQSGQPVVLGFDLRGDLDPTQCRRVFGPSAEKVLERFETNSTINLTGLGHVELGEDNGQSHGEDLTLFRIDANCTEAISYSGIPLDRLSMSMTATSSQTQVDPLEFGLAGGHGEGSLLFQHKDNNSTLDLDLAIHRVDRAGFVQALQ